MDDQLLAWKAEVDSYLQSIDFADGDHLWSNYQDAVGILIRLQEIQNDISWEEVTDRASPDMKKFRTMILAKSIETLEKVIQYESRKLTARQLEKDLDR